MNADDLRQLIEDLGFIFGSVHVNHIDPDIRPGDDRWRASYDTCTEHVCVRIRRVTETVRAAL